MWKPVEQPSPAELPAGATVAAPVERALPAEVAYRFVADGDKRPLLILRECELCKGTDHALLGRSLDNEVTALLTQWFRCVKVPTNVLDEKHPLHAFFQRSKPDERIPHLFFSDCDGGNKAALPGDQSQTQLWETMYGFLDRCYQGDARKVVKELRGLLGQYDTIDTKESDVRARIDKEIEKNGPESDKLPKYDADLKKITSERQELLAREQKLRNLALKSLNETVPVPMAVPGEAK